MTRNRQTASETAQPLRQCVGPDSNAALYDLHKVRRILTQDSLSIAVRAVQVGSKIILLDNDGHPIFLSRDRAAQGHWPLLLTGTYNNVGLSKNIAPQLIASLH
jgi:hypothetical protein